MKICLNLLFWSFYHLYKDISFFHEYVYQCMAVVAMGLVRSRVQPPPFAQNFEKNKNFFLSSTEWETLKYMHLYIIEQFFIYLHIMKYKVEIFCKIFKLLQIVLELKIKLMIIHY